MVTPPPPAGGAFGTAEGILTHMNMVTPPPPAGGAPSGREP